MCSSDLVQQMLVGLALGFSVRIVFSPALLAKAVFADPELTLDLPRGITAATGMDALTHAVEAYLNRWPHGDTKGHSIAATRMIFANLERACEHGEDVETREAMALAARAHARHRWVPLPTSHRGGHGRVSARGT